MIIIYLIFCLIASYNLGGWWAVILCFFLLEVISYMIKNK